MTVYNTILYASLEKPLNKIIIYNRHVKNKLYEGPFEKVPKQLFEMNVRERLYEYTVKTLNLWITTT